MGSALTILITLSFSIFVVKTAAVALTLTGLSPNIAKFQALSAFSGTGYTSKETEQVINYPVRRKIAMILMVIGNIGLVAVMSTVVVSFVAVEKNVELLFAQLAWLLGGLVILWFLTLSKTAERGINRVLRKVLLRFTELGQLPFSRLLQVNDNWSVAEHRITYGALDDRLAVASLKSRLAEDEELLGIRNGAGETVCRFDGDYQIQAGDSIIVFANDNTHMSLFAAEQEA